MGLYNEDNIYLGLNQTGISKSLLMDKDEEYKHTATAAIALLPTQLIQ